MQILMLCGVFAKENEQEVILQARGGVEFSANLFQQKLIAGFRELPHRFDVISAPFIGAYPMRSKTFYFKGFEKSQDQCHYVSFHNMWGLRNMSRAAALKKAVRQFALQQDQDKLILVYCPHTPFLEAAVYAKKLDPDIRICMYVPDLPNYMNLAEKRSRIYDFAKKYDISVLIKLMEQVDSFVLLTEQMKDCLPVGRKPYLIAEGIISNSAETPDRDQTDDNSIRYIVYTGKMNRKFGVADLIDGFSHLKNPGYRLILCGRGDCDAYAEAAANRDLRIQVLGQVTPDEAVKWQGRASVLVNPRPNNEEYTKYSFPSKNIEYLLSGKPVVAYLLDGMPAVYSSFLYCVKDSSNPARAIAESLEQALQDSPEEISKRHLLFLEYATENLCAASIAKAITRMNI